MKILVVSDSHGASSALDEAICRHPEAETVLFLGDGASDLAEVMPFHPRIGFLAVRGNCDFHALPDEDGSLERTVTFGGVRFLMMHGHTKGVKEGIDRAAYYGESLGVRAVLYGHTHRAALTDVGNVTLFNPGSIGYDGSYGLITIENGEVSFQVLSL